MIVGLISCSTNSEHKKPNEQLKSIDLDFEFIDKTYLIDLPVNFKSDNHLGEDFEVFYFTANDSIKKKYNSIGLYLGNHPSSLISEYEDSVGFIDYGQDKRSNTIIDKKITWNNFIYKENYYSETLIKNMNSIGDCFHFFIVSTDSSRIDDLKYFCETFRLIKNKLQPTSHIPNGCLLPRYRAIAKHEQTTNESSPEVTKIYSLFNVV